eukprot:6048922-Pleurochrysis_carterae.AAC.1
MDNKQTAADLEYVWDIELRATRLDSIPSRHAVLHHTPPGPMHATRPKQGARRADDMLTS